MLTHFNIKSKPLIGLLDILSKKINKPDSLLATSTGPTRTLTGLKCNKNCKKLNIELIEKSLEIEVVASLAA